MANDLIEIRPEVGFLIAPKFINISGRNDLNIIMTAIHPGTSVNFLPKTGGSVRPQFGADLFHYFSSPRFGGASKSMS